jgi:HTH-type transcriptional regulator/antitoxin HigA
MKFSKERKKSMIRSKTYIATPPGATIAEQLEVQGLSLQSFGEQMHLSPTETRALMDGDIALTSTMASQLEQVLGVPAAFWSNLEEIYRQKAKKAAAENIAC